MKNRLLLCATVLFALGLVGCDKDEPSKLPNGEPDAAKYERYKYMYKYSDDFYPSSVTVYHTVEGKAKTKLYDYMNGGSFSTQIFSKRLNDDKQGADYYEAIATADSVDFILVRWDVSMQFQNDGDVYSVRYRRGDKKAGNPLDDASYVESKGEEGVCDKAFAYTFDERMYGVLNPYELPRQDKIVEEWDSTKKLGDELGYVEWFGCFPSTTTTHYKNMTSHSVEIYYYGYTARRAAEDAPLKLVEESGKIEIAPNQVLEFVCDRGISGNVNYLSPVSSDSARVVFDGARERWFKWKKYEYRNMCDFKYYPKIGDDELQYIIDEALYEGAAEIK